MIIELACTMLWVKINFFMQKKKKSLGIVNVFSNKINRF